MLFNPLFLQIGVKPELVDSSKSTKLNNTSYLFSDIIRVISDNSLSAGSQVQNNLFVNGSNGSSGLDNFLNLFNIKTPLSQTTENSQNPATVNLEELLKELLSNGTGGNIGESADIAQSLSSPGNQVNLLVNKGDIDNFLQKLFGVLPSLKMITGGDKNFIVKPVSDGSKNDKKQVEDAIINLLQTNNNIILNFNLGKEQFKIEITKIDGSADNSASESTQNAGTGSNIFTGQGNQQNKGIQINAGSKPEINSNTGTTGSANQKTSEQNPVSNEITGQVQVTTENPVTVNQVITKTETGKPVSSNVQHVVQKAEYLQNKTDINSGNPESIKQTAGDKLNNSEVISQNPLSFNSSNENVIEKNSAAAGSLKITKQTIDPSGKNIVKEISKVADGQNSSTGANILASKLVTGTVSADKSKFILTVKSTSVQSKIPDVINKEQTEKITEQIVMGSSNVKSNIEIEFSDLGQAKQPSQNQVKADTQNYSKDANELFNPPLTLKLSLKQQLKSVEKGSTEIPNISQDNRKNTTIPAEGTLKTAADLESGQASAGIKPEIMFEKGQVQTQLQDVEAMNPTLKSGQAESDKKVNENDASVKSNNHASSSDGGKSVNPSNGDGQDIDQRFKEEKQQSGELKAGINQSAGEIDKAVSFKDKLLNNGVQSENSMKTISVSDISKELAKIINQKESQSVVLQLKPENLGKIKLAVDVVNNVVHTRVEVENESVKQIVQNNLDQLKQSLNMNGLQLSNVDVSLSGGQQKSYKPLGSKKKFQYAEKDTKISEDAESLTTRTLGYNTYEYLI